MTPAIDNPRLVILAGPNGAGKSTSAPSLLRGAFQVDAFVNADTIARGLSAFAPERVAFQAGRVMLTRLDALADDAASFAFETTLATRSYARWLRLPRMRAYTVSLIFLWLNSAELAVARVAERVRAGGHHVPADIVRRRYHRGLRNFFELYRPQCDNWLVFDNSHPHNP